MTARVFVLFFGVFVCLADSAGAGELDEGQDWYFSMNTGQRSEL